MTNTSPKLPSISKLKKKQYEEGAKLTLQNAENLFQIAKSCHEKEFYGNGVSILITALEELSKATYLQIKAHNPNITIKDLDSYFHKHLIKHKAIIRLSIKSVLKDANKNIKNKESRFAFIIIAFIAIYFIKEFDLSFDEIEKARQSGYYVNFVQTEKCWESPMDLISGGEFLEWINIVNSLFENTKHDIFREGLTEAHIRQFILDLDDKNVYLRN